jgi:hypothetical protein
LRSQLPARFWLCGYDFVDGRDKRGHDGERPIMSQINSYRYKSQIRGQSVAFMARLLVRPFETAPPHYAVP